MTFTVELVEAIASMAGLDFTYRGVGGCDRPSHGKAGKPSPRLGLRAWLMMAQGDVCPWCDRDLPVFERVEVCHVVSRGPLRRGFLTEVRDENGAIMSRGGNLFAGHAECNVTQRDEYGDILTPDMFKRPELIATEYPVSTMGQFAQFDPNYA